MAATTKKATAKKSEPPTLKSFNPRTGEVVEEIIPVAPAEVAEVVAQARKVAPEWGSLSVEGRIRHLKQVRYRLYDLMDEIVEVVSRETGKPKAEALAHDVLPVSIMLYYFERITAKTLKSHPNSRFWAALSGASGRTEWRPFGVVGAITPWNYPITNSFLGFAPALFAGNVVVIKPSEVTPASGELLRKLLEPLPSGVATVIQGGGDVGAALVDAPCDKISFVGSPVTGRKICEAAARHLTPVVMELGGKDAAVVLEDADLDVASSGIVWGSFFNSGQTCASIERVYVNEKVADEFKGLLLDKLSQVKFQDEVGSLTFKPQLDIVKAHIKQAVEKGATVLAGGEEGDNSSGSLWFKPTIVEGVTTEMDVLTHESFGPVISLVPVRDDEEAIKRVNEDAVNLTTSIWTKNKKHAESVGARVRTGVVSVNFHGETPAATWAPWGGVGESGFGRLNGKLGLQEFSVPVDVAFNTLPGKKRLWWYPYDEATNTALRGAAEFLSARDLKGKVAGLKAVGGNIVTALKNKI